MTANADAATSERRGRAAVWLLVLVWAVWFCLRWITFPEGDQEEAVNGNLAVDAVRGLVAPPVYYQYRPWANGPLVFGVLLTPFYRLFGSSMAWIKLLGGLFVLGGTIVWSVMIRRAWGAGAAALFLIWWIFPPPYLGQMMHVVWANHMETVFLGGLILLPLVRSADRPPRAHSVIAHGLLAGFASFFCMQALAFAAAAAATGLWRWKKAGLRWLALAAPAFAVGLAPKFVLGAATRQPVMQDPYGPSIAGRFAGLFIDTVPIAAGYTAPWAQIAVVVACAAGVGWIVWRLVARGGRRLGEPGEPAVWFGRALVLTLVFWLAAYAVGPNIVADPSDSYWYRYLLPLFPIGMAATCFLLTDLPPRRYAWLALVPLIAQGATDVYLRRIAETGVSRVLDRSAGWYLTAQRGDDYTCFLGTDLPVYWDRLSEERWQKSAGVLERVAGTQSGVDVDPAAQLRTIERVAIEWRPTAYEALGRWLGFTRGIALATDAGRDAGIDREAIAFGAGTAAVVGLWLDPRAAGEDANDLVGAGLNADAVDPAVARAFLRGVGSELQHGFSSQPGVPDAAAFLLDGRAGAESRPPNADSIRHLELTLAVARRIAGALPEHLRASLTEGAGREAGFRRDDAGARAVDSWCRLLGIEDPGPQIEPFERGYVRGTAGYLLAFYNHLPRAVPAEREIVSDDRSEAIAAALARRGVTMRAVETPLAGWVLDRPSEHAGDAR